LSIYENKFYSDLCGVLCFYIPFNLLAVDIMRSDK